MRLRSLSATTKKTPYVAVFGQEPRSNSCVLEILQEQGVLDEDTLPQNLIETEDDTQSNDANLTMRNRLPVRNRNSVWHQLMIVKQHQLRSACH